jgi:hypothetical protein
MTTEANDTQQRLQLNKHHSDSNRLEPEAPGFDPARKMPQNPRYHDDSSTDDGWSSGINTPSSTPGGRDETPIEAVTDPGIQAKIDHPFTGTYPASPRKQQAQAHAPDLGDQTCAGLTTLIIVLLFALGFWYTELLNPISFDSQNPTATVTGTHTCTVAETRFQKFASLTVTSLVTETYLALPTMLDSPDFWHSALASLVLTTTATATTTETMTIPTTTTVEKPVTVTLEKHVTTTVLPPQRDRVYCDSLIGDCIHELRLCIPVTVASRWPQGERNYCYGSNRECMRCKINNGGDCQWIE